MMEIDRKRRGWYCFLCVAAIVLQFGALTIAGENPGPAESATEALRRGVEFWRTWKIDDAESAFREAARLEPSSLAAAVGLARVARARIDYAGALTLLDQAARRHPNSALLLNEYGSIYLAAEEPGQARRYFASALQMSPTDAQATVGLAGVDLLERDFQSAIGRLAQCLEREPQNSSARSMLARALLEINRESESAEEARRAIAANPFNVEALFVLAYVRSTERKADESRSLARRVVSLDPYNFSARRMLSQYLDGRAGYEQRIAEPARKHYARGRSLKESGELSRAAEELEGALRIEPRYYRALIAIADVWLRKGEYNRAAAAAQLATVVDPEGSIAHFELSIAHRLISERARIAVGGVDFASLFYDGPAPPAYAATREIFPDYRLLTRRQQAVIDLAVGPLAMFLPRLVSRKARHYLLAFDQRPGDLQGFPDVVGEKTFDGRYYASIRGVGGRVTVSGIEYLDQAALGGFNTIAHEFAHQVHIAALDKGEVSEIRRLYERARREARMLDYYAAANEEEYFAQGYEAFISERKRPSAGLTGRHTRHELLARDPEFYKFLVKLTGKTEARIVGRAF